jgi:hypothetical protein
MSWTSEEPCDDPDFSWPVLLPLSRQTRVGITLTNQKNGWCDKTIAKQYLKWLRGQFPTGAIVLIWDVFSAHRDSEVEAYAVEKAIRLIFMPPAMTDV